MPTWLGGVYASNRQCQRHRMKGRRKTTLRFHEILDVLTFYIHPKKLASLSTHSVFSTFSVATCPVVFIGYFLSRIHDITSKFPFFSGGKNLVLILQLAGCAKSLSREIAGNLLGTLETIFKGRRHRNDFNILRSMGNSSPTITVSHLRG